LADIAQSQSDVVDLLRAAAIRGQMAITEHVRTHPELDGMATTLTAVMLEGNRLGMLHVGDSRAYLLRLGVLYQLSHDDTYVQSLDDRSLLTIEQAHATLSATSL
jgi:serine/threonine protein phosphatase PrpC